MNSELHLVIDVCFAVCGGYVGWSICKEMCRGRYIKCYECLVDCERDLTAVEDILEEFREATTSIVHKIELVGDEEDWENAAETSRNYQWHEIAPLREALDKLRHYGQENEDETE